MTRSKERSANRSRAASPATHRTGHPRRTRIVEHRVLVIAPDQARIRRLADRGGETAGGASGVEHAGTAADPAESNHDGRPEREVVARIALGVELRRAIPITNDGLLFPLIVYLIVHREPLAFSSAPHGADPHLGEEIVEGIEAVIDGPLSGAALSGGRGG
jgi:hypothetical protein